MTEENVILVEIDIEKLSRLKEESAQGKHALASLEFIRKFLKEEYPDIYIKLTEREKSGN